ncbi:MIP family Ig-specific serine endopeptidase, partial [Ureaplasma diversum]|uniref:MIP family Ig-specific serine endopeptidase n=1 Tax=Ureaplasma diversum TaxID=42094 RepID=UPI00056F863C
MSFKFKKSLLAILGSIVVSATTLSVVACVSERQETKNQPESSNQKQVIDQSNKQITNKPNLTKNQSQPLLLDQLQQDIKLENNKYWLRFKVNNFYNNKYLVVELKSTSNNAIKSNKTKINNDGSVRVSFDHLDNGLYSLNKISIFESHDSDNVITSYDNLNYKLNVNQTSNSLNNNNNNNNNPIVDNKTGEQPNPNPKTNPELNGSFKPSTPNQPPIIFGPPPQVVKETTRAPELLLDEKTIYNKLKDRTFALGFNSNDQYYTNPNTGQHYTIYSYPMGTAWLLDYAWKNNDKNSKEVMLYLATNVHVYRRAFNTLDQKYKEKFPEYFTQDAQKNAKVQSFVLGVPKKDASVEPINNFKEYGFNNRALYFINENVSDNVFLYINYKKAPKVFENPKTVFAALNIFDDKTNKEWIDKALIKPTKEYNRVHLGKDFAVFGVKVNLEELEKLTKPEVNEWPEFMQLKEHITKAMASIDNDIKRYSKNKYPNHDQSRVPYATFDYPSLYREPENINKQAFNLDKYITSPNTDKMYVVGFPGTNHFQTLWRNNPKDLNTPKNWLNYHSFTNLFTSENVFDQFSASAPFGYGVTMINSSLYNGASGSLVANEYGIPVGIFHATNSRQAYDISKNGHYVPFVQIANSSVYGPAHNLIDGSDKTKFPKQVKSYRQNLKALSENNGEFAEYSKTALYPDG